MKIQKKYWAFIPARGGSKSIKYKNLKKIGEKTLIQIQYEIAKKKSNLSKIVVSSEDSKIINYCKKMGYDFDLRPKKYSKDDTNLYDTLINFLNRQNEDLPDYIFISEPTSPFVRLKDYKNLEKIINKKNYDSAYTIAKPFHTNLAINQRLIENDLVKFINKKRYSITQKHKKKQTYIFGNLILINVSSLLKGVRPFFGKCGFNVIQWPYNINIDSKEELEFAKIMQNYISIDLST